ncbi:MAG: hypothetical protein J5J00_17110 [Deltaproteobacteria bacterium]|nr:hypothetical protein [Deltaproteobacteria bacterium]
METHRSRIARDIELTHRQKEILFGSMLGDGYLVRTTRGYAFRVNHCLGQKPLVDWKYYELQTLTNSPPRTYKNSYYFRTVSHQLFSQLREMFYEQNRKRIPKMLDEFLTPLALAVWIMDDGAKDGRQLRINTQSFSLEENEILLKFMKAKFGIWATINRDKNRYRLRVSAASMSNVRQLVTPHIIPSMQYKLSL